MQIKINDVSRIQLLPDNPTELAVLQHMNTFDKANFSITSPAKVAEHEDFFFSNYSFVIQFVDER